MKAIRILLLVALAIAFAAAPLYAQEGDFGEASVYHYPEIKPAYSVWGGYGFADANGSRRAGEYIYFNDNFAGGLSVVAFPFPHRVHLDVNLRNGKDYFSDMRYAYKDLLTIRSVNRSVYHNFGNIELHSFAPSPVSNDPTEDNYGYRAAFGTVSVRLKAPNYPAHVFVNTWYMDKDGDRQQRRAGGAGFFGAPGSLVRTTERRDVDWTTYDITAGLNAHLNFIEAEYSHTEMRFNADGGINSAFYAASSQRDAGIYPNSVIPDITGRTDTIKVHTTYTGRFVASGTFSVDSSDNDTSGAERDTYLAAGEIVWTPVAKFTTAVRMRYIERDLDNPNMLPAGYLGFAVYNSPLTGIRNSVSADITSVSLSSRYRPTTQVTLGVDASFKHTERDHSEEWNLPHDTDETMVGASVSLRPVKDVKVNAKYRYKFYNDPSTTIQPDHSHRADVSVTLTPLTRLVLFASYGLVREDRDNYNLDGRDDAVGNGRKVKMDKIMASASILVLDNLTVTGSYGYWDHHVKQQVTRQSAPPALPDPLSLEEYTDITNVYTASVDLSPIERLHLSGSFSYTMAKAGYNAPTGEGNFSRLKTRETSYMFRGDYEFIKDLLVGFEFEYRDFNDLIENPLNPEIQDGTAQTYLVTLKKRW